MNRQFALVSPETAPVALRTIVGADIEDLRTWKNANRAAFFFKKEISPADQLAWFDGYLARPNDFMFVVETGKTRAGCMGFRILDGAADCYNIIGLPATRGRGILGKAMRLMCSYILSRHAQRVGCRVLKDNPAVAWYEKCGYRIAAEKEDYCQMGLDLARFVACAFEETRLRTGAK